MELLDKFPYEKITISGICKQAEITRATFYLHYDHIDQVIDEILDDALSLDRLDGYLMDLCTTSTNIPGAQKGSDEELYGQLDLLLPPCQRAATHPKYHVLFKNQSLSYIILDKLYQHEHDTQVPLMQKLYHVSEREAELIFLYRMYGNFAINQKLGWKRTAEWYEIQTLFNGIFGPK